MTSELRHGPFGIELIQSMARPTPWTDTLDRMRGMAVQHSRFAAARSVVTSRSGLDARPGQMDERGTAFPRRLRVPRLQRHPGTDVRITRAVRLTRRAVSDGEVVQMNLLDGEPSVRHQLAQQRGRFWTVLERSTDLECRPRC